MGFCMTVAGDWSDVVEGLPTAAAEDRADGDAEEDEKEDAEDLEDDHGCASSLACSSATAFSR